MAEVTPVSGFLGTIRRRGKTGVWCPILAVTSRRNSLAKGQQLKTAVPRLKEFSSSLPGVSVFKMVDYFECAVNGKEPLRRFPGIPRGIFERNFNSQQTVVMRGCDVA